jgi:hypothetical protein
MGSNPSICPLADACHLAGSCDPATAACTYPPLAALEAQSLTLQGESVTTVAWGGAAPSVSYDLAMGLLSELRSDRGIRRAACVGGNVSGTSLVDWHASPPQGQGYYYLVRVEGTCAAASYAGTYGFASTGQERLATEPCP